MMLRAVTKNPTFFNCVQFVIDRWKEYEETQDSQSAAFRNLMMGKSFLRTEKARQNPAWEVTSNIILDQLDLEPAQKSSVTQFIDEMIFVITNEGAKQVTDLHQFLDELQAYFEKSQAKIVTDWKEAPPPFHANFLAAAEPIEDREYAEHFTKYLMAQYDRIRRFHHQPSSKKMVRFIAPGEKESLYTVLVDKAELQKVREMEEIEPHRGRGKA